MVESVSSIATETVRARQLSEERALTEANAAHEAMELASSLASTLAQQNERAAMERQAQEVSGRA